MIRRIVYVAAVLPAAAIAYYSYGPLDPLASFDAAREETPHAVRADAHLSYGYAGGYFDAGGAFHGQDKATTVFLGVAKLGWTFDRNWEADVVLHGANYHDGNTGAFANGLGDVWLVGKAGWFTKDGGEFRMGPRLGIRFPGDQSKVFSDGNVAVDLAAVGYYDMRGRAFQLDCQLGFRHDGDSGRFAQAPGLSIYALADPAWTLDAEERWLAGLTLGGYVGVGTVKTGLFWLGPRAQYVIDQNVRLEAGFLFPVAGSSYEVGNYAYPVPRYTTVYFGVQSVIPTEW